MTKWSKPFTDYFISTTHPAIDRIGRWELMSYGLESATTNQSESFNYVLKRLNDWKECPVDSMALSLFRLTQFQMAEIKRGRAGLGNYVLRDGISTIELSTDETVTPPMDIVDSIRNAGTLLVRQQSAGVDASADPSSSADSNS